MRKRVPALVLLLVAAVGAFWLLPYRTTPAGAIEKASSGGFWPHAWGVTPIDSADFAVLLSAEYRGGAAVLLQRGPHAELWLTRRWGPLWRAVNMTAVPAPDATHRLSSAGLGSKWDSDPNDPTSASAFAGFVDDPRVTAVEVAGETANVAETHAYLFARLTNDIYFFQPSRAVTADGAPLYRITERSLMDWVPVGAPR